MIATNSPESTADAVVDRPRAVPVWVPAPVFLLAPPRSFTSVVCAMLGQHPQMYGFPETQLFTADTLAGTWSKRPHADYPQHGLRRLVAQLFYGEQTEESVKLAQGWLRRRAHFNTGFIFESLAERVYPLIPVEKSPDVVLDDCSLERMYTFFPQARFIHLLRHPRGHGESNIRVLKKLAEQGQTLPRWMFCRGSRNAADDSSKQGGSEVLDPQRGWLVHNRRIGTFLESVPNEQKIQVRGEELLTDADEGLRRIAKWLGLRTDSEAIERMKHPEQSPYALPGPSGARYGNSLFFLERPELRPDRVKPQTLDGPLPWRDDGQGFLPEVKRLAREFGYT
jgi:hypothetical protein